MLLGIFSNVKARPRLRRKKIEQVGCVNQLPVFSANDVASWQGGWPRRLLLKQITQHSVAKGENIFIEIKCSQMLSSILHKQINRRHLAKIPISMLPRTYQSGHFLPESGQFFALVCIHNTEKVPHHNVQNPYVHNGRVEQLGKIW